MEKRDYYAVLGVARSASESDIKSAYRQKARKLHPDANTGDEKALAELKAVNEAHDVLKDPQKRRTYDQFGHEGLSGGHPGAGGNTDFGEFFSAFDNIFGDFMGGGRSQGRHGAERGADLRYNLRITLEEAYFGIKKNLRVTTTAACEACDGNGTEMGVEPLTCPTCNGRGKVRAQQGFFHIERTCPSCGGRGRTITNPCTKCSGDGRVRQSKTITVEVPSGIESGTRIRHSGQGEAGLRGGHPGDLYVFVEVKEHEVFERDGLDLYCRIPISMTKAALGGTVEVQRVDGGRSKVQIPAGSQSGKRLRLAGKGMPKLRDSRRRGNMYIELFVETPVNLSNKQKELLKEFSDLESEDNSHQGGIFGKMKDLWEDVSS